MTKNQALETYTKNSDLAEISDESYFLMLHLFLTLQTRKKKTPKFNPKKEFVVLGKKPKERIIIK